MGWLNSKVEIFNMVGIKFLLCIGIFFIGISASNAQDKFTISGVITDAYNNESLIGVSINITSLKKGTTTNAYGFYSLTLPKGEYIILIHYLGYKTIQKKLSLSKNTSHNFELLEEIAQLDEVVLTKKAYYQESQMSVATISAKGIKNIPVLLGEADVISAIIMLPGVSRSGEAASGFNVRGGSTDQNLILLDEATIFNSSHLFGLFSVFNPDAIKNLTLYKGGIPARYGGRVSSVLDIYQKEGNNKEFGLSGGIGAVSSRLLVEGPTIKEKGAFLIGARASYAHLFLKLSDNNNSASFYDVNAKLNHKINANNSLFLSAYFGKDFFKITDNFKNSYGNSIVNLRWNHLFSEKLFSNLSLIYSNYFYNLELDFAGFNWNSGIDNLNLKYNFKHYLSNELQLNYGINNTYHIFNPGEIEPTSEASGILENKLTKKYANEFAAYIDVEQQLTSNLSLQYGLRWSNFIRLGQDELNVYEDNNPIVFNNSFQIYQKAKPISVASFSRSEKLITYSNFEPRLALSYSFNPQTSIKANYTRIAQYLHLISNTNSPTPLDVWTPSGPFIKPQIADQVGVGFFKNNHNFSIESEIFYKKVQNRIDYVDGADLIANNAIEQVLLNGKSRAYGWELLLKKSKGKFTAMFAYTLLKSEQKTEGRTVTEPGINFGQWYNSAYNKTHDISINASYNINEKWKINSNFIFQTGQPTNYPTGQFKFKNLTIPIFGPRNTENLPNYHRIDISAVFTPKKNRSTKWQRHWVFGIYNLYNRKNAYSITFSKKYRYWW